MHTPTTIHVAPGSEIDRLLDRVSAGPIDLERRGERFRLNRIESDSDATIWIGYDPARTIAGMRAAAGSWNDIDAKELKAYSYRAREEGTRLLDPDHSATGEITRPTAIWPEPTGTPSRFQAC